MFEWLPRRVFRNGRSVPVADAVSIPQPKRMTSIMSLIETMSRVDDDAFASAMAVALTADLHIRMIGGAPAGFTAEDVRRVSKNLRDHGVLQNMQINVNTHGTDGRTRPTAEDAIAIAVQRAAEAAEEEARRQAALAAETEAPPPTVDD